MKKLFALLLILTMIFSLAACGGETSNDSSKDVEVMSFESAKGDDKEETEGSAADEKTQEAAETEEAVEAEEAEAISEASEDFPVVGGYAQAVKTVNIRTGAGKSYSKSEYNEKLYGGEIIFIQDIKEADGYTWYQTVNGWVADDGTWFAPLDKYASEICKHDPTFYEIFSICKIAEDEASYYWYWSGGGGYGCYIQSKQNPSDIEWDIPYGSQEYNAAALWHYFYTVNDIEVVKFNKMYSAQTCAVAYDDDDMFEFDATEWHIVDASGDHACWAVSDIDGEWVTEDLDAALAEHGMHVVQ